MLAGQLEREGGREEGGAGLHHGRARVRQGQRKGEKIEAASKGISEQRSHGKP